MVKFQSFRADRLATAPCRRPCSRGSTWCVMIAWAAGPGLELSLVGRDLGNRHEEFDPSSSTRFGPRGFVKVEWRLP